MLGLGSIVNYLNETLFSLLLWTRSILPLLTVHKKIKRHELSTLGPGELASDLN